MSRLLVFGLSKRMVLPAIFQRGRDTPDKTIQTLATAHLIARTHLRSFASRRKARRTHRPEGRSSHPVGKAAPRPAARVGQERAGS
jgi:hypothetical protein